MDVVKMLALNQDKIDNTLIFFHIYIVEKRDMCPQYLMKCIKYDTLTAISVQRKSLYMDWEHTISNKSTMQLCRENLPFM